MNRTRPLLALASGLLSTAAFPNASLYWLAWIALVPLLGALSGANGRQGFELGFLAGLVHYLSLLYWLIHTMHIYGHLPVIVGAGVLLLLAAVLALFWGGFGLVVTRVGCRPTVGLVIIIPAAWVGLEYLRTYLFTGFPWALWGYSQQPLLPIIQIADLAGVYGVSGLVVLVNGAVGLGALFVTRGTWQRQQIPFATVVVAVGLAAAAVTGAVFYGYQRMAQIETATAAAATRRVGIVQGNVDQAVKWDPAYQRTTIRKYLSLSRRIETNRPDLIVWPETATPFYFTNPYETRLNRLVQQGVRRIGTYVLTGSPSVRRESGTTNYYNSAYLVDPGGNPVGKYDKAHLVPYGEYVPLKRWFPFLGKMVEEIGDFKPGEKGETLVWQGRPIGVQICYEIIFPSLSRAMANNGAELLVNITNDAWFGKTGAPYQHFSTAVFRAVENRRGLVRSANTGVSGFVDPVGRIAAATPLYEDAVIISEMPLLKDRSIYTCIGDLFAQLCAAGVLLFSVLRVKNGTLRPATRDQEDPSCHPI